VESPSPQDPPIFKEEQSIGTYIGERNVPPLPSAPKAAGNSAAQFRDVIRFLFPILKNYTNKL
jgi:hypothetical protein